MGGAGGGSVGGSVGAAGSALSSLTTEDGSSQVVNGDVEAVGGRGGNASSGGLLSSDGAAGTAHGSFSANNQVSLKVVGTGGNGGSTSSGFSGVGGDGGSGDATASAMSANDAASAMAIAQGGGGGSGSFAGNGGGGGHAAADAIAGTGHDATATVYVYGGDGGGSASDDGQGGAGASAGATSAVAGRAVNATLTLDQYVYCGDGGGGDVGGNGGNAVSSESYTDSGYATATEIANIIATGGDGGPGGTGGYASASLSLRATHAIDDTLVQALGGKGGAAYAPGGSAVASAAFNAGGTVNATVEADAAIGAPAQAATTVTAGTGGTVTTIATAGTALGLVRSETASVVGVGVGGTTDKVSGTVGSGIPAFVDNLQGVAYAAGAPGQSFGQAARAANADINGSFGAYAAYFAASELGGGHSSGTGSETVTSTVSFTVDLTQINVAQDYVLGLYNGTVTGTGVTRVKFDLTVNGSDVADVSFNSATEAKTYFTNHGIDLRKELSGSSATISATLPVTSDSAGSGFYGDFLVANGTDTAYSATSYALSDQYKNLVLTGSGNVTGVGNALDNVLTGNSGNNILNGGAGADTMAGGAGNDTYFVDNPGDVVKENANAGTDTDTVHATISYILPDNVEYLVLDGAGNINATGNALNDVIAGNGGNNVLNGGAGADTMAGGEGADTFLDRTPSESTVAAPDTIKDFSSGSDKIDLTALRLTSASQIAIGATYLTVDTNRDGIADMRINFSTANAVKPGDILKGIPSAAARSHPLMTDAAHHAQEAVLHGAFVDHGLYG